MSDHVLLGYIIKPFGIKGGVFIKALNEDSQSLAVKKAVQIKPKSGPAQTLTIRSIIKGGRFFFDGVLDRESAEQLRDSEVWILRSQLPQLPDDEYYLFDLMGARVIDKDHDSLGEITGFSSNNAQIIFEVKTGLNKLALIPLIKPIVEKIDYENKTIVVNLPSGLLDL